MLCSWDLQLMLESPFPFFISQNCWNSDIQNFSAKFSIFAYIHWKLAILSSAMIMTSLWRHTWNVGTYFGYAKRRPLAILWYQLDVSGVSFSSFFFGGGGLTSPFTPLVRCVIKKAWKAKKKVKVHVTYCIPWSRLFFKPRSDFLSKMLIKSTLYLIKMVITGKQKQ